MPKYHQKLPSAGAERESLRVKGQFWTPDWVAEAMVAYAISGGSKEIFDPAVGAGIFFKAAKTIAAETGINLKFAGREIDQQALEQAKGNGLSEEDLSKVSIADFVLDPPKNILSAIVCNPPYIRHHRLSSEVKAKLKKLSIDIIGTTLDGRAGFHVYFLLRALQLLAKDGRLAFIMPADTCEGIFSSTLWKWITETYKLDAVITFSPEASPFPGVDTNAVIFLIQNDRPIDKFLWARCIQADTDELKAWVTAVFQLPGESLSVHQRNLSEGLSTGFSRPPVENESDDPTLGEFAKVMRGIATGANEFFFLTKTRAEEIGIPYKYLLPAIGRTRDVSGNVIDSNTIKALDEAGKPTLLFSLDNTPSDQLPKTLREYLKRGEELGLHKRSLISTRRPWYKMEVRPVPPFLFAYLGRRNARFIRNQAGAMPLTGFLCVYARNNSPQFISQLWTILSNPAAINNLSLVGKSYGGGAIKVEPRSLERLRLPLKIVLESGIQYNKEIRNQSSTLGASQLSLLGM
ncbi:MAG: SAM-dependent methyltransferase [Acidobacteria bacterium]|nr:SAM-dependent methyltransferase [Acidobacteriota bacterium]